MKRDWRLELTAFLLVGLFLSGVAPSEGVASSREPLRNGWRFLLQPGLDQSGFPTILRRRHHFQWIWGLLPDGHIDCSRLSDDLAWEEVRVPHTWNATDTHDAGNGYARGTGCYRRTLEPRPEWGGQRVRLRLLGAYARPKVYANGELLGTYHAGYTGALIELPQKLVDGVGPVRIDVELSNIHRIEVLPARFDPDFNLYGGLYREVFLEVVDPVHWRTDELWVQPRRRASGTWEVPLSLALVNSSRRPESVSLIARLRAPGGAIVARWSETREVAPGVRTQVSGLLEPVSKPRLWSPDSPSLYRVELELRRAGDLVEGWSTRVGFREARFDPEKGFFLNGASLRLRGVNRHQDAPGLGNALPAAMQAEDARRIKAMGANFVRTSHYPQHPAFLEACDEIGLLVFEEIASWKSTHEAEAFLEAGEAMFRAMLRRDRNHPSIIVWGMFNEGRSASLFERLLAIAAEEDPTRPVTYAEHRFEEALEEGVASLVSLHAINYDTEYLEEYRAALPEHAYFQSEVAVASRSQRGNWGKEIDQVLEIEEDLETLSKLDFLAGTTFWSFRDYGTERLAKPERTVHYSGVVDAWGNPKASYRYLQAAWGGNYEPVLLAPPTPSAMIHRRPRAYAALLEPQGRWIVAAASACPEMRLEADGAAPLSKRSKTSLFLWSLGERPKSLELSAVCDGKSVKSVWMEPGPPVALEVESSASAIPADGSRLGRVEVHVVDATGRRATNFFDSVTLQEEGPLRIRGPGGEPRIEIRGGVGAIYIEGVGSGRARLTVRSENLPSVEVPLEIIDAVEE